MTDPSGAVVIGADVALTGTSLTGTKAMKSDDRGNYRFVNLPPGQYTLTVTANGFQTFKRVDLTIGVGRLPTVNVALQVGSPIHRD